MKIIYIHQYFKTYAEGGSSRSYYLAKALVQAGHEVEMITAHNAKKYRKAVIDGITVHYLPVFYDNKFGFWQRILAFLAFIVQAYRLAASIPNPGICYATSTPLTVGAIALALQWRKRVPFYFEVRDLWPLAPVQMGVVRNWLLKKLLFALERKIYQRAEKIIALSPGMVPYIAEQVDRSKIYVISNMADCSFFQHEPKNVRLAEQYGVSGKFVITYCGAIGEVNRLDYLLNAAGYLQANRCPEVHFLIAGKGKELEKLQRLAVQYNLHNVTFLGCLTKYKVRELMSITDAVYVSFARKPVLQTSSPNKFFDGLAAGKLCIVNTKGWMKDLIESEGCGVYADPLQPQRLMEKVMFYLRNRTALKQAQAKARQLAENHFSRELLTRRFIRMFTSEPIIQRPTRETQPVSVN
jgi:glycosyltransferase involved in cell wall biosynthesis